jgi:uncharacterized ubiquitin-like protein YukD
MIVDITGGRKKNRELIEDLCHYIVGKYLPRFHDKLTLNISIENVEEASADCIWSYTNYRPREFDIRVSNKLDIDDIILYVCHELVHVKQYVKGELYDYSRKKGSRWKNKYFVNANTIYKTAPWEKDALKLDTIWAENYRNHRMNK